MPSCNHSFSHQHIQVCVSHYILPCLSHPLPSSNSRRNYPLHSILLQKHIEANRKKKHSKKPTRFLIFTLYPKCVCAPIAARSTKRQNRRDAENVSYSLTAFYIFPLSSLIRSSETFFGLFDLLPDAPVSNPTGRRGEVYTYVQYILDASSCRWKSAFARHHD